MPGIVDNCDGFYKVSSGDQCGTIAAKHGISVAQFQSWNTEINGGTSSHHLFFSLPLLRRTILSD
jgi:Pyruvate/2-oxoacid:ferredoxin oxidoreductase gamma subunit